MNKLTITLTLLLTAASSYAQFDNFKGITCESRNTTKSGDWIEKIQVLREERKDTFKMIHTPKYDAQVESPQEITLGTSLRLRELDIKRPYILDLTNGTNITNPSKIGTSIESVEQLTRTPYASSSLLYAKVIFSILNYLVDGGRNGHTIEKRNVEFHPTNCNEIL
jgi:hypothetical protein